MIAIRTMGALDMPGHGPRKLPAPRVYVAVIVLWSIFGLIYDAGQARIANVMAWITVLTAMVLGPFGPTAVQFLSYISSNFSNTTNPTPQGTQTA